MRRKRKGETNPETLENKLQTTEREPSNANVSYAVHVEEVS